MIRSNFAQEKQKLHHASAVLHADEQRCETSEMIKTDAECHGIESTNNVDYAAFSQSNLPKNIQEVHTAFHQAKNDNKYPDHGIVGSGVFTEEENMLSARRCAWLRHRIILYKDNMESLGEFENSEKNGSDMVQKFWSAVISHCFETFRGTESETLSNMDTTASNDVIDVMLFRDLICVGLDLLANENFSTKVDRERSSATSFHMELPSSETTEFRNIAYKFQDWKFNRSIRPQNPPINVEGYHIFYRR